VKTLQAKHLDDATILDYVGMINTTEGRWTHRRDFADILPDVPPKVILAKCRSLIKRKLLEGCACGCRGDFQLPKA